MRRLCVVLVSCGATVAIASGQSAQTPATAASFAIEHVTVVDVETGSRAADQTVVIRGNRISAVGPAARTAAPAGARVVDGRGKFLIPGLWDMHVHSLEHLGIDYSDGMEPYKLFIANGVTGVRDMGSNFIQLVVGRKRIESGHLVAPRIIASGPMLEGGQPAFNMALISKSVSTPESGRLAVDALAEAGVDFLKIHNGIPRDTYFAIAEEARRRRMVFAGHVPAGVTIAEASDAGQRSIEHLASLIDACVDASALPPAETNPSQPIEINRGRCDAALRQLVRNRTWLAPTLVSSVPRTSAHQAEADAQRRYVKAERRATCAPFPAQERPGARARYELSLRLTRMAQEAGVALLIATDSATCRLPGFADLEELGRLVEAGLSPLQSLRAATLNPAQYLNMTDSVGTIASGKLADLVLLEGDPLTDIRNTARIAAVVANGQLVEDAARRKLFDDVLASAAGKKAATN